MKGAGDGAWLTTLSLHHSPIGGPGNGASGTGWQAF